MSTRDELAGVLADTINKQFKDMKVAYFLDGTDSTPTDIKEFVSTGSTMLDLAISNKPNGGIAVGRITELNGLESSGKSLLGAHMLGTDAPEIMQSIAIAVKAKLKKEDFDLTVGIHPSAAEEFVTMRTAKN